MARTTITVYVAPRWDSEDPGHARIIVVPQRRWPYFHPYWFPNLRFVLASPTASFQYKRGYNWRKARQPIKVVPGDQFLIRSEPPPNHPPIARSVSPELVARSVSPEVITRSVSPELVARSVSPEVIARSVSPELVARSVSPQVHVRRGTIKIHQK
ncbi:hypothetical protein BDZ89DRAFT_1130721 [Hymenopellis radicata]|nr:hypothetical protein BDZ89DRAFT_1130721 [Hymenopellis radicata]